jgi:hypothetical protein
LGSRGARAARGRELEGFFEGRLPASVLSVWDRDPLAEATSVRRERFRLSGIDERTGAFLDELDDELAGAVVAVGEEVAVEASPSSWSG